MENRESEIREWLKSHEEKGRTVGRTIPSFDYESMAYLLSIIDSLRASQKELMEAGKLIEKDLSLLENLKDESWLRPYGYEYDDRLELTLKDLRRLKEAIEKVKEEK